MRLLAPLTIAALIWTCPLQAQEPVSLRYTGFDHIAVDESERHWTQVFNAEPEVTLLTGAFAAHISVQRPSVRIEFTALYSEHHCRDIRQSSAFIVSKCPARLIVYRPDNKPEARQTDDVCLLHSGKQFPSADQIGWNDVKANITLTNPPSMVVFAIVEGETLSECTTRIPLD